MDTDKIFDDKFGSQLPEQGQSFSLPMQDVASAIGYADINAAMELFRAWVENSGLVVFDLCAGIIVLGRRYTKPAQA